MKDLKVIYESNSGVRCVRIFLEFRSEIEPPYVSAYGGSNQRLNGRNKAAKGVRVLLHNLVLYSTQ